MNNVNPPAWSASVNEPFYIYIYMVVFHTECTTTMVPAFSKVIGISILALRNSSYLGVVL